MRDAREKRAARAGAGARRPPRRRAWTRDGQATLAALPLAPHAGHRRSELQALNEHLTQQIDELDQQVSAQARERPQACRLMTHPGVGPVTALATEVFLGDPSRFADAKALASYVGMIPSEYSSGDRQRLGRLTKQGNPLLRFLWCEAAIHAVRRDRRAWAASIDANCNRKGSAKPASPWRGSWASGSGFCCAIRSTTRSSAVARHHAATAR